MRKILFTSNSPINFRKAWTCQGFETLQAKEDYAVLEQDQMLERITVYKKEHKISHVFTFDFVPRLAMCCAALDLWYVSWVLDCPHPVLWSKWARWKKCCIFVFDCEQYLRLRQRGLAQVFYLPLCADVEGFEQCIVGETGTEERYQADVSFVGNLYNDANHSAYDQITYIPPYARGYLESLMMAQRKIWGGDLLWEGINDKTWELLKEYVKWDMGDSYEEGIYKVSFTNLLGQKITQMERKEMCSLLARRFSFALYTDSDTSFDTLIDNRGHADYNTEMPLIFRHSKINVHVTLRTITSGMSLRVVDVLACGGFLLTNYQKEIAEYFENGKELVMYTDFQDLCRKIAYYLEHEDERKEIACAGCAKVRQKFTYSEGVSAIAEILEKIDEKSTGCI